MSRLVRPLLLTCVSLALTFACVGKRGSGREQVSNDDADAAARARTTHEGSKVQAGSDAQELATVDVVTLDPGEARPCERMCGRIGDCLQSAEGSTPAEANGAEFACLDSCIYADPTKSASVAFQDCDEKSSCGELLGCARSRWDAVTDARRSVAIATNFAAVLDTCETACVTLQSCNYYYQMPSDLDDRGTPEFLMVVKACTEGCRNSGEQGFAMFAECTNESSCDQFWACTSGGIRSYP